MGTHLKYRPDIDGLRALSILPVIAYHLNIGFTKGGFIGVDIFFVISGYLITSIIADDIEDNRYSIVRFYDRRMRRILPAFFAMLFATIAGAYVFLFPSDIVDFARSLHYSVFFAANMGFYDTAGYFARQAESIPLLHVWSMSIEEQFYLLFPLLLAPLLRFGRARTLALLGGVAVLSFAVMIALKDADQPAAFFLLPARAWELMAGCLLALGNLPAPRGRMLRNVLAFAGFAIVIACVGAFNKNVQFPGWVSILPCLGAVLIIYTGSSADTGVYRLLASKPAVFIGKISYSLYLWHWPLIVFYKQASGNGLAVLDRVGLFAVSLLLAYASWRWIEQPFRRKTNPIPSRQVAFACLAAAACSVSCAFYLSSGNGLEARFPEDIRKRAAYRYEPATPMRAGTCFVTRSFARIKMDPGTCLALSKTKPNYLILGDSHAAHLWAGLSSEFTEYNFLQATASGCKPVDGTGGSARCTELMAAMLKDFVPTAGIDGVIISADWKKPDIALLVKTVERLRKRPDSNLKVIVFGPIVTYTDRLPAVLTLSAIRHDPQLAAARRRKEAFLLDAEMAGKIVAAGGDYVSVTGALCKTFETCTVTDDQDDPIQYDEAHLTKKGSMLLARALRTARKFGPEALQQSTELDRAKPEPSGSL